MTDPTPKPQHLPGVEFQNLVSILERAFAAEEGATVDSPKRLVDKDTGRLREHDIVLTRVTHHGPSLTALECKDKSRPVGVPDVEAFFTKLEKTGVNQGVIVSAKGFTDTARTKAAAMNIGCMELAEAENFPWVGDAVFIQTFRNFEEINFYIQLGTIVPEPWTAYLDNGEAMTPQHGQAILTSVLTEEAYQAATKEPLIDTYTINDPPVYVEDAEGGRHKALSLSITFKLVVTESRPPFSLHTYTSAHAEFQVATTEIEIPGYDHKLVMIRGEDGIKVSIAANPAKA